MPAPIFVIPPRPLITPLCVSVVPEATSKVPPNTGARVVSRSMVTLAVVRKETQSLKWPAFLFAYMTALAYTLSFLVYQCGKLLGFS